MNDDLKRLRDEARKRHQAANKKASRLRRVNGVEINGTEYDVRRDPSKIKRYNRAQLTAYINELNEFTGRRNTFVAGDTGTPIPATKWREYKQLENQFNALGKQHDAKLDIKLPGQDQTVKQRKRAMKPTDMRKAAGEASFSPFFHLDRKPQNIAGTQAVERLIKSMKNKLSPRYLPTTLTNQRAGMEKMLKEIGANEFLEKSRQLNDFQFQVFWTDVPSARNISHNYEVMKMRGEQGPKRSDAETTSAYLDEAEKLLDWALTLEPPTNKPNTKPKSRRKGR